MMTTSQTIPKVYLRLPTKRYSSYALVGILMCYVGRNQCFIFGDSVGFTNAMVFFSPFSIRNISKKTIEDIIKINGML